MQSESYNKYLAKLRFGCDQLQMVAITLAKSNLVNTKEDMDERLKAIDSAIGYLQDVKRAILFFKNRLG